MKKVVQLIAAIFISSTSLYAQNFGVKTGISFNTFAGEETSETFDGYSSSMKHGYMVGFSAGGTFEYRFNDNFALSTGLGFSQKGTKITQDFSFAFGGDSYSAESEMKITTNYLEIPLLVKAGLQTGDVKIYGIFGGVFDVGLLGSVKYTSTETETYQGQTNTYTDSDTDALTFGRAENGDLNRLNVALTPGIGVEFNKFQIEATYEIGLTNIIPEDSDMGWKSRAICLTVGYQFGKKK